MTIRVLSFDFDGCLMNVPYIKDPNKDLIAANKALLASIQECNKDYAKVYGMVGSNRQSPSVDELNAYNAMKGSCYPRLLEVCKVLGITPETFLLGDLFNGLAAGTTFKTSLEKIQAEDNLYHIPDEFEEYLEFQKNHEWAFDDSKITLVYAQIQHIASQNPNEPIDYEFYDDREDILRSVHDFFKQNPSMVPPNVTIKLHKYAGEDVKDFEPLNGDSHSKIDYNYRETTLKMVWQAAQENMDLYESYISPSTKPTAFGKLIKVAELVKVQLPEALQKIVNMIAPVQAPASDITVEKADGSATKEALTSEAEHQITEDATNKLFPLWADIKRDGNDDRLLRHHKAPVGGGHVSTNPFSVPYYDSQKGKAEAERDARTKALFGKASTGGMFGPRPLQTNADAQDRTNPFEAFKAKS